jgi:hypothetical protein
MTTVTLFQAGTDAEFKGSDLFEVVEMANAEGWEVDYNQVELAREGFGLIDGKVYYSVS